MGCCLFSRISKDLYLFQIDSLQNELISNKMLGSSKNFVFLYLLEQ